MKAFATHQRVLKLICVFPLAEEAATWKRLLVFIIGASVLLSQATALLASLVYASKYATVNLEDALKTIFQIAAYINTTYVLTVAFLKRKQMLKLVHKFQRIYDASFGQTSFQYLAKANEKGEAIAKLFLQASAMFLVSSMMIGVGLVSYSFITFGRFDADELFLPYNYVDPWKHQKLRGWITEYTFQLISGDLYLIISMIFASFFISVCLHHCAFSEQFQALTNQLNGNTLNLDAGFANHNHEANDNINNNIDHQKRMKFLIYKMVLFHTLTKETVTETVNLFSPFILIQCIGGVIHIAACIFQLDLAMHHPGIQTILAFVYVCWSSTNTFIYCFCGNLAMESLIQIPHWLYTSNWHELSYENQRYFILLIANSQRPTIFHGFIINSNLESYAKIMKSVGSYYMAFKAVTEH